MRAFVIISEKTELIITLYVLDIFRTRKRFIFLMIRPLLSVESHSSCPTITQIFNSDAKKKTTMEAGVSKDSLITLNYKA